jgi:predicted DNA-binding transcriptional regulator AlpA
MTETPKPAAAAADISEQIRRANLANIIAKVRARKTLTAAEQALVAEFEEEQRARREDADGSADEPLPEAGMSRRAVARVLKQEVKNLQKKVAMGKTLSASERAILQGMMAGDAAPDGKTFADNQVELAEILGVNRKTIQRWLKEAGAPKPAARGAWNIAEWRDWMSRTGKRAIDSDEGPSKSALEAKKLLLQNEKLEHEIAVLKSDYLHIDDVRREIGSMVAEAKKILLSVPAGLAPLVVGLSVPEAEKRIRAKVDEVLDQLHTGRVA